MVLQDNFLIERTCPGPSAEYRRPFAQPGEGRRPKLAGPREMVIEDDMMPPDDDFRSHHKSAGILLDMRRTLRPGVRRERHRCRRSSRLRKSFRQAHLRPYLESW